jgi:hypothetical protein
VQLDAKVAVIERRQQIPAPRIVHDERAIVSEEARLRD